MEIWRGLIACLHHSPNLSFASVAIAPTSHSLSRIHLSKASKLLARCLPFLVTGSRFWQELRSINTDGEVGRLISERAIKSAGDAIENTIL